MKLSAVCISVTLVALATSILPADAADWNNGAGSMKDRGQAGVPVPIPEAYQETYKYYLRGDLGFTPKSSAKVTALGPPLSLLPVSDWERNAFVGFGFGRYITPSLRLEFGIDLRPKHNVAAGGSKFYPSQSGDGGTKTILSGPIVIYTGPSLNYGQMNGSLTA